VSDGVDLAEKLGQIAELFSPRIVATLNDYKVQVAKAQGEFVWHSHPETDELFLVLKGRLEIQLRDRTVVLDEGELFVVPRGVEHCPRAIEEVHVLLIEPLGTVNTGDAVGSNLTAVEQSI
jgi:mannose-6-phosphate isomerase-like protein (cupin superfamily)